MQVIVDTPRRAGSHRHRQTTASCSYASSRVPDRPGSVASTPKCGAVHCRPPPSPETRSRRRDRLENPCSEPQGSVARLAVNARNDWRAERDSNPRSPGSKIVAGARNDAELRLVSLQGTARSGTEGADRRHRLSDGARRHHVGPADAARPATLAGTHLSRHQAALSRFSRRIRGCRGPCAGARRFGQQLTGSSRSGTPRPRSGCRPQTR